MKEIIIANLGELESAVEQFLPSIEGESIVAFYGEMGVGKTTFIKALAKALGVKEGVNSPTFNLINEYIDGEGEPIYHMDLYRVERIEEAYEIGVEEYLYSGHLTLIEWPQKIEELLPPEIVKVTITLLEGGVRSLLLSIE